MKTGLFEIDPLSFSCVHPRSYLRHPRSDFCPVNSQPPSGILPCPPLRLPAVPFSRGRVMLTTAPTLHQLYNLFPDSPQKPEAVEVPAAAVPQPYHRLLVHTHHMTVTVEKFYHSPVDVKVLNTRSNGNE